MSNVMNSNKFELTGSAFIGAGNTGYTTQNITFNKSNTSSSTFEVGYEAELVATVVGVKLGASYGFNSTNTVTTTFSNSTNVGGNVPSVKRTSGLTTSFQWELAWYNYTKSNQKFSVVNYVVK